QTLDTANLTRPLCSTPSAPPCLRNPCSGESPAFECRSARTLFHRTNGKPQTAPAQPAMNASPDSPISNQCAARTPSLSNSQAPPVRPPSRQQNRSVHLHCRCESHPQTACAAFRPLRLAQKSASSVAADQADESNLFLRG